MSRPSKLALPLRDGVSASAVACPAGSWLTVLDFLAQRLPLVARADWAERLQRGEVLDEAGQALAADAPYRSGRRLYYYRQLDREPEVPFVEDILYQDAHLLVADKPHFLPITPRGRYVQNTLLTRLKRRTGLADLTPIHRLDRETAGLCLFSVRPADRDAYQALFRDRQVDKCYEAVAPLPAPDHRWVQALRGEGLLYASRLQERPEAFMQMQEVPGPANAHTHIRCLHALPGELGFYELRPRTGQKHQLRAHMNALGLPLLGDRIYPRLEPVEAVPDFDRPLQLLARSLRFQDPVTGELRHFLSRRVLQAL